MDVSIRADNKATLAAMRRAVEDRRRAIANELRRAGDAYQKDVAHNFMSGRGGKLGGLSQTALAGLTKRQIAKQAGIARARLDTNPLTAGRALGLNTRSKQARGGWVVTVRIEGDTVRLVVGNRVPYVRFHTDTYRPRGLPRRNPIRLPSGRLWQEHMSSPDLATRLLGAGFSSDRGGAS